LAPRQSDMVRARTDESVNAKLDRAKSHIPAPIREYFFLERAEEAVASLSPELQERVHVLAEAAERRSRAAELLSDEDQLPAALLLHRESATLSIVALLAARQREVDPAMPADRAFVALEELIADGSLPSAPAELERAKVVMTEKSALAIDALDPAEAASRVKA